MTQRLLNAPGVVNGNSSDNGGRLDCFVDEFVIRRDNVDGLYRS
jgi:hypothetical protein